MKISCKCGHWIVDQTDYLPYKGMIIRDQDEEDVMQQISDDVVSFINAIVAGRREHWIKERYEGIGDELDDDNVVADILTRCWAARSLDIYQCEECGRVFIDKYTRSGEMRCFTPEEEDWAGTLKSERFSGDHPPLAQGS